MCLSVGIAHAEPAPVLPPSPTLPDTTPTRIGIVGNDVIRPTSSANAETYKKVPIDKGKIGNYIKKMPKGGFLELGLIVGITALSEAVDYLIDEAGTVRYTNYTWFISKNGVEQTFTSLPDACRAWITAGNMPYVYVKSTVSMIQTSRGYAIPLGNCYYNNKGVSGYFNVSVKRETKRDNEILLDEIADKLINEAKRGAPNAVRIINDWADDEIKRNPDAYPDVVPQPQPQPQPDPVPNPDPNPKPNPLPVPSPVPQPTPSPNPNPIGDPKTNPSPNPNAPPSGNPATNPNPADSPSGTPNAQPDPATNPSDGTKPNEQTFKFELPPFCSWASHVCDFIDWVKSEPPKPDEMPKLPIQEVNNDFDINPNLYNAQGQCQAPISINLGVGTIEIPYDFLCQFFIKNSPVIVAIAYLLGAYIVLGKR